MPAAIAVPLIVGAASAGASVYASRAGSSAAKRGAQLQTNSANYAADLEAKANQRALEFTQAQEAQRQKEFQITQDRNKVIYDAEMARDQSRYDDQQARYTTRRNDLAPYRAFGAGSLAQLAQPIPRAGGPGSLGARMGS
jgi:hypothetical protein